MSNAVTKHMARTYIQEAPAPGVLSSKFRTAPENYYSSETIEFDIEREGEEVAPVLTDIKNGYTKFALDEYTNKEFKAPVMKEGFSINAFDMMKRQAGQISFTDPNFRANAMRQFMDHMRYGGKRQRRTMELMASQVLQTGTITLKDDQGDAAYIIDFKPKSTHFPTFGTAWTDHENATPIANIKSLCDVINTDGQSKPKELWLGDGAYENMLQCEEFLNFTNTRHVKIIDVEPRDVSPGATYMGTLTATGYRLDMYTYRGEYKDVKATANARYLADESVLILAENVRLDATFGAIPQIVPPEARAMSFLSGRMPMASVGLDFTTNAWVSPDGEAINGTLGSRPLLIPTSIDRFGCGKAY